MQYFVLCELRRMMEVIRTIPLGRVKPQRFRHALPTCPSGNTAITDAYPDNARGDIGAIELLPYLVGVARRWPEIVLLVCRDDGQERCDT